MYLVISAFVDLGTGERVEAGGMFTPASAAQARSLIDAGCIEPAEQPATPAEQEKPKRRSSGNG